MIEAAPRQGFAARLLRRAEGRVTALRPHIPNSFSAEAAQEAPLLERTEEITATPQSSSRQAPDPPVAAAPRQSPPEPEPFRLMPGEPPHLLPANLRPDAARPASDPEVETDARIPTDPSLSPRPHAERRLRSEERRADSLSTAVMQLLGPQLAETYPAALTAEPQPARDAIAAMGADVSVASAPAAAREVVSVATEQAKLQIHIGELIIAPEPRAPAREAPPPAAWEPPLSLADYRASRSRERG